MTLLLTNVPCYAIVVKTIDIKGLYSIEREEFLEMFGIRDGSTIDRHLVREGIKRTFLKGVFDDIVVEVSDGDAVDVKITVVEKDFIRHIRVAGADAFSGKTIKSLFGLKEAEVMRYDLLESSIEDLKDNIS